MVSCSEESYFNSNISDLDANIGEASLRNGNSEKELFVISYEIDMTTITQFDCDPNGDVANATDFACNTLSAGPISELNFIPINIQGITVSAGIGLLP